MKVPPAAATCKVSLNTILTYTIYITYHLPPGHYFQSQISRSATARARTARRAHRHPSDVERAVAES